MKRYLIIGVVMAALLAACGGDTGTSTTAGATDTTAGATDTTAGATDTTAGLLKQRPGARTRRRRPLAGWMSSSLPPRPRAR